MSMFSTISRPRPGSHRRRGAVAATAGAGYAHALFADHDSNRTVLEYVWIGFWHMVGGWDHLLFILDVVLIAGALKPAAKLISLFVLGHSLTLIIATVADWKLNATLVDVVIALSLVYVGIQVSWRLHRHPRRSAAPIRPRRTTPPTRSPPKREPHPRHRRRSGDHPLRPQPA